MNSDNNQELEVNKKGCSRDKIDGTNFISLTTHLMSIYFYFTERATHPYTQSLRLKERMPTKITGGR